MAVKADLADSVAHLQEAGRVTKAQPVALRAVDRADSEDHLQVAQEAVEDSVVLVATHRWRRHKPNLIRRSQRF